MSTYLVSLFILAGYVGGQVWADRGAGPPLELESVGAAARVAVFGRCPGAKDERSWGKSFSFFL